MKRHLIPLIVLFCLTLKSEAQDTCQTISLGFFLESLKQIDLRKEESLVYRKYPTFSFKEFKPKEGQVGDSFYEIGYNRQQQIKEIIHHVKVDELVISYKFSVFDFSTFRVLIYKTKLNSAEYTFTPTAFLMMKGRGNYPRNFMLNVVPMFGNLGGLYQPLSYQDFPVGNLDDISVIMILNEELYPTSLLRLAKGQIVFDSDIHYEVGTRKIEYESASIFFTSDSKPKLKVDENTCISRIIFHGERPDLVLTIYPDIGDTELPLWIYYGAHEYGKKGE